jgi:hypothetical protein
VDDYDLALYPPGETDWPLERGKVLFVQTLLDLGVPWADVVHATAPYFGELKPPPMPIVNPLDAPPFTPPYFDVARHTVEKWLRVVDEAWRVYLAQCASDIREYRQRLIDSGYKEPARTRRTTGVYTPGDGKLPIAEESIRYGWAAGYYYEAWRGKPLGWSEGGGR